MTACKSAARRERDRECDRHVSSCHLNPAVYGAGGVYDGLSEGCYEFDLEKGSVSGGGTGRYCKEISHTEYNCGPGEPPCECEDDEDCISPKSGGGGEQVCKDCYRVWL